jgi:hypothetical protein
MIRGKDMAGELPACHGYYMKETVSRIRNSPVPGVAATPVTIGESLADQDVCEHVRADHRVNDTRKGARISLKLTAGNKS